MMMYETLNAVEVNPFSIEKGEELVIDQYILDKLSNAELVNYFISLVDEEFPYKKKSQEMIYNTSIFILTQSLDLNLYEDRTKAFERVFGILIPVLTKV